MTRLGLHPAIPFQRTTFGTPRRLVQSQSLRICQDTKRRLVVFYMRAQEHISNIFPPFFMFVSETGPSEVGVNPRPRSRASIGRPNESKTSMLDTTCASSIGKDYLRKAGKVDFLHNYLLENERPGFGTAAQAPKKRWRNLRSFLSTVKPPRSKRRIRQFNFDL